VLLEREGYVVMDLDEYFNEIVEPTIAEFAEDPTSRRRAFLACVTTFHAVDYLAPPGGALKKRELQQRFRSESHEFAVVERIANAFKHVKKGNLNDPNSQPLRSGQEILRPPAQWGVAVWDLSCWDDPVGGVTLDQQRTIDLLATVRAAAGFIRAQSRH
jgi:hypothetical protein